jgi:hypothetical protein
VQTERQLPIRYNIALVPISDGIVSLSKDKDGRFFADGTELTTDDLSNRYYQRKVRGFKR